MEKRKTKSGQYIKRTIVGEKYSFSTFGFDIEVEAVKIVNPRETEVKMTKLIEDDSSGDSKSFLEPLKRMIKEGFVMKIQNLNLRTL